jgi:hypothetical protein
MNSGQTIFSQLMDFTPRYEFRRCVDRYHGHYKVKSFSCWDQFLTMAFAQLTYRESLRDIEACLRTTPTKLYHMGIRGQVSRNTLAHANQVRDWKIYADFAQALITIARSLYINEPFGLELQQAVYALDATTIDLCLSLFPWAQFRRRKAAVKLHALLDLRGSIPTVVIVTGGQIHEVNILDQLVWEPGAIYLMDRGYLDFSRLYRIHQSGAFFVTRAKKRFDCQRLYSHPVDKTTGLHCDQIVTQSGSQTGLSGAAATHPLRRCGQPKTAGLFDQQLSPTGLDHRRVVSLSLAGGVILSMDQATPANQSLLRNLRECRQNSGLDRHLSLRARRDPQKTSQLGPQSALDSTDSQRLAFRENPHPASAFSFCLG